MPDPAPIDQDFDHFVLTHDGRLTLHDDDRSTSTPLPLHEARLGDLTVARGYYRAKSGREYELTWPYGYDLTHEGPMRPTPSSGLVHGHHHTDWSCVVAALRTARETDDQLALLILMTQAAVSERSVLAATWCERASVILRRRKRYAQEVALLESVLQHVPESQRDILSERLIKASELQQATPRMIKRHRRTSHD